ncbi:hypothetical protein AN641_00660 [Candidatus Epulonipiscioides gigas]|nr:hypothetical protein AN641_00660 [Epulopiscium sp. SCG-C07WGA-EpuloA2]
MLQIEDITKKEFKKTTLNRGYSIEDVDLFMMEIINSMENITAENRELKEQNSNLTQAIQYYKSMEQTIQNALVLAEKTAADTKRDAEEIANNKKEAILRDIETVKNGAKSDAKKMREEAKLEAKKLKDEAKLEAKKLQDEAAKKVQELDSKSKELIKKNKQELQKLMKSYSEFKKNIKSIIQEQLNNLEKPSPADEIESSIKQLVGDVEKNPVLKSTTSQSKFKTQNQAPTEQSSTQSTPNIKKDLPIYDEAEIKKTAGTIETLLSDAIEGMSFEMTYSKK